MRKDGRLGGRLFLKIFVESRKGGFRPVQAVRLRSADVRPKGHMGRSQMLSQLLLFRPTRRLVWQ